MKRLLKALLCVWVFSACQTSEEIPYEIQRGNFRQTLTETGELVTADTRNIMLTSYGRYWHRFKIIGLVDHGTVVSAGDSIIQLDPSDVQQFIVDRETNLENQEAALQKIIVNNEIQSKTLDANLRSEEAAFNLSKLRLESSRFESDRKRYISELQFRQAQIRYEKAKRNIEYSRIIAENDEIIQRIRMEQVRRMHQMAVDVLPKLTIRAPISGIFQVARRGRRGRTPLVIGDEVRIGNALGSIPDMTWMKVNTMVNEIDRTKLFEGQEVIVRMDALPSVKFKGEVEKISILCREDNLRKVFDVVVKLNDSDERLKPGMTVSCEFVASDLKDVLFVPNDCVLREHGRHFIYVSNLVGYEKVPVRFVSRNHQYSVIEGNIAVGQKVLPIEQINE